MEGFDDEFAEEVYESLDSKCEAYPMEEELQEYETESGSSSVTFLLQFRIRFAHIPDDYESCDMYLDNVKHSTKEYSAWAGEDQLTARDLTKLLDDMGVAPVEPYMVRTILVCAAKMMRAPRFRNRNILHMLVKIHVAGEPDD